MSPASSPRASVPGLATRSSVTAAIMVKRMEKDTVFSDNRAACQSQSSRPTWRRLPLTQPITPARVMAAHDRRTPSKRTATRVVATATGTSRTDAKDRRHGRACQAIPGDGTIVHAAAAAFGRTEAGSRMPTHSSAHPAPSSSPATASVSQWAIRYVRLKAMMTAHPAAAVNHRLRARPGPTKISTTRTAVTDAVRAWPEGKAPPLVATSDPGGRGRSTHDLIGPMDNSAHASASAKVARARHRRSTTEGPRSRPAAATSPARHR